MNALPRLDDESGRPLAAIAGHPPLPGEAIEGCAFAKRCSYAGEPCMTTRPMLRRSSVDREDAWRACHLPAATVMGDLR
jgi:oligopeptide transport system ATP-binding protein